MDETTTTKRRKHVDTIFRMMSEGEKLTDWEKNTLKKELKRLYGKKK